jgi:hypothetical protein
VLSQEELCLIAIDRYTILEADRKPFPKASDNIAEPGNVSTDPGLTEQLCERIDELPEGQYQTRYCDTTELETRKDMHHDEQHNPSRRPFPLLDAVGRADTVRIPASSGSRCRFFAASEPASV